MQTPHSLSSSAKVGLRQLRRADLAEADRIFRLAFGTFVSMPDPLKFAEGREFVRARWEVDASASLGAEADGQLLGSNFAIRWGTVGFFGPLTVRPDWWDRGVAKRLLEATMELFAAWQVRHAGLFTFPHSPKHIGLYGKFGFAPRFLTAVMSKAISSAGPAQSILRFSALTKDRQAEALAASRQLTNSLFEGLDLEREIQGIHQHQLGDTLFLWDSSHLDGFAVCHFGRGSEGGENCCYIKFAAARPGPEAARVFDRLLGSCEALASIQRLPAIEAGVNLACEDAYRRLLARGFQTRIQGVAMDKPNQAAYHRPEAYVLDDWR